MATKSGGWNFRVMKRTYTSSKGHKEDVYGIHEVYYKTKESDEVDGFTMDTIAPEASSLKKLKAELERMLKACDKQVLNYNKLDKKSGSGK